MWVTVVIDGCLMVNLVLTLSAYLMTTDPERVVRYIRRRHRAETWYEDESHAQTAIEVVRLWGRSLWLMVVIWGLLTGFLVGLHWHGLFWRQG